MSTHRAHRKIILENAVLDAMAASQAYRDVFPSLSLLQVPGLPACGNCGDSVSVQRRSENYRQVRVAATTLAPDKLDRLKNLLNTDLLIVLMRSPDGNVHETRL